MRYAVVFKTYTWDSFIERQAHRFLDAIGDGGDFFISVDETNAQFPNLPFDRVVRTSNAKLINHGLANRFEKGSLIWWNADYPHYTFHHEHGEYDYYLFAEYDTVIQTPIDTLMARIAAAQADFVGMPIREPLQEWFWSAPHRQVYPADQLRGTLNCVSIFSNRALALLSRRRLEMTNDATVPYWPSSEVFVPSEIERAGYVSRSIEEFGDASAYDWYPPTLEDDLSKLPDRVFLHPVLDQARYVAVNLRSDPSLLSYLRPSSALRRSLARLPPSTYLHLFPAAMMRRARASLRARLEQFRERLQGQLPTS